MSTQDLLNQAVNDFGMAQAGESYGLFMCQAGTKVVIGDFEQLNVPPLTALEQIDEPESIELVVLPKKFLAAGGTGENDGDDDDDDEPDFANPPLSARARAAMAAAGGGGGDDDDDDDDSDDSDDSDDAGGSGNVGEELDAAAASTVSVSTGGETFEFDLRSMSRKEANKMADKVARRVAKLTEYVADRERSADVNDTKVRRKLQIATTEIEELCVKLVSIEQLLAEGDDTEISEMSERRIERFRNDGSDSSAKSGAGSPFVRAKKVRRASSSNVGASGGGGGDSTPETARKSSKLQHSSSSSSAKKVKSSKKDKTGSGGASDKKKDKGLSAPCGMCGETFTYDVRAPKWVYVPSIVGSSRLTVCSSCRRALASDPLVRVEDVDAPEKAVFDMRLVSAVGPPTPVVFDDLHVPRFIDSPSCSYIGTELVVPDVCVSRYKNCGTLFISSLLRPGGTRLANPSPILSCRVVSPYALTYHEDETLQAYNVVTCANDPSTVGCGAAFAGETSSRTRAIVANERWIVVMSKERVCVWPWRVVLAHAQHESEPVRRMNFGEASDNPRDDFSALDGHRLLVGSNQSFSVFDLLSGNCTFRFNKRLQLQDTVTSSFYGIRFAGESVMTHEQGGVRVWRLSSSSETSSSGGTGTGGGSGGGAVTPRRESGGGESGASGSMEAPPLITTPTEDSILSTVYADGEWLVFGDNVGRLRVRSVAASTAGVGRSGKLKALLGGDVDADRVPVEYLNSEQWITDSTKKSKASSSKKKEKDAPAAAGGLRKLSSFANKINFIERYGNRIFCAQESGLLTVWDLTKRDADQPLVQHQCRGPVRSFAHLFGTVMVASNERGDGDQGDVGDSNEQFLSVVVSYFGASRFRPDLMQPMPAQVPADWRALIILGADADGLNDKGDRPWYWPVIRKFATLSDRVKAVRGHMICATANTADAALRTVGSVPEMLAATDATVRAALGELYPPTFSARWSDWSAESPGATLAILPGAEPFDPLSVMVIIHGDGFVKSYAMFSRFGSSPTPAKVWAHIHKHLMSAVATTKISADKKSSGLSSLFKKK